MKTTFESFVLSSSFTGSKKAQWGDNWNHHRITVKNQESGLRTSFDFWGSIADPEIDTESKLVFSFQCFVSDATSGSESFEDFCLEFGYDTDSRSAEKTWKACKRSYGKLSRIYDGDIYDLLNSLQEYEENN